MSGGPFDDLIPKKPKAAPSPAVHPDNPFADLVPAPEKAGHFANAVDQVAGFGRGLVNDFPGTLASFVTAPIHSFVDAVLSPEAGDARPDPRGGKGGNSAHLPLGGNYDAEHGGTAPGRRTQAGVQTLVNLAIPAAAGKVTSALGGNLLARLAGTATAGAAGGAAYSPNDPLAGALAGAVLAPGIHGLARGMGAAADATLRPRETGPAVQIGPVRFGPQVEGRSTRNALKEIADRAAQDQAAGAGPNVPAHRSLPPLALDQFGPEVKGFAEGIANRPGPGRPIIQRALVARQTEMRPAISRMLDETTGTTADDGAALVRRLADEHAQLDAAHETALAQRAAGRAAPNAATAQAALDAWRQTLGGEVAGGTKALADYVEQKNQTANEHFDRARAATAGQPMQSPTLDAITKTPIGQAALEWARMQKANRMSKLPRAEVASGATTTHTADVPPQALPAAAPEYAADLEPGRNRMVGFERDGHTRYARMTKEVADAKAAMDAHTQRMGENGLAEHGAEWYGNERELAPPAEWAKFERLRADYRDALARNHEHGADLVRQESARREALQRGEDPDAPMTPDDGTFTIEHSTGESALAPPKAETVPDPETLHYAKQYLAKAARLGVHDGQGGTIATQAQGVLNVWGKIRDEMPDVWKAADDATAEKFRVIDAHNMGRDLMRTQLNPSGAKALHTSLDAVEQRFGKMTPDEQSAARIGMQGAVTDWLKSGGSPKTLAAQLRLPGSAMARRIALATGDPSAPAALADRLTPAAKPLVPPMPVRGALSPESQAAATGLDAFKYRTAPSGDAPAKSLAVLAQSREAMSPMQKDVVQRANAQALRGKLDAMRGGTKSPGSVFDFQRPERAAQMRGGFQSPAQMDDFRHAIASWDAAQTQANDALGGSPSGRRNAANAQASLKVPGNLKSAAATLVDKVTRGALTKNRLAMEAEAARMLTAPTLKLMPPGQRASLMYQRLSQLMDAAAPRLLAAPNARDDR